jgi:diguanylate cyclase (GGDEF)-like protein/PAS domain S-box-containing protein
MENLSKYSDIGSFASCYSGLAVGVLVILDNGRIGYLNDEAERILSIKIKDFVNQPLDKLAIEIIDESEDSSVSLADAFAMVRSRGAGRCFTKAWVSAPQLSTPCWWRLSIDSISRQDAGQSYTIISFVDITPLCEQVKSNNLYTELFNACGEAIVIADDGFTVQEVNEAFCVLTGEERLDVVGQELALIKFIKLDKQVYQNFRSQLNSSGFWQGEISYRGKHGELPILLSVSRLTLDPKTQQSAYAFIFSDITELKLARERLDFLAYHDPLTRLPNRAMCQLRYQHSIDRVSRTGKSVALLYFDLDDFKNINDSLGHSIGDLLLKQCAQRLRQSVRKQDTVARLGGDEFLVILEDVGDAVQVKAIAEKLLQVMEPAFELGDQQRYVTSSLGIAIFPVHGNTFDELLKHADAALNSSKSSGRNNYRIYRSEYSERLSRRAQLEHDLRNALNNQNFELYFQPQLNLKNATLCGAEALLRWNHPSGELVSPAEFIPIIEHTGLILPVGRWVIRDALEKLKQWRLQGLSLSRVAVNVSALQLQNDQLLDYLNGLLLELDLQPQDLEVEITESVFVDNAVVPKVLQDMHQQGFYLALDDFGTGYSSLSYLTRLPFNKIKLDRSFVAKIETEPSSRAMAKSLVALAKTLGFEVTAEGVENIEQLRFLMENGCDQAQGYFIGRPVPNKLFIEQLSHFDQQTLLQNLKFKAQV